MTRITKEIQDKAIKTLTKPNIVIEECNLKEKGTKYYKVNTSSKVADAEHLGVTLIEFSVTPVWRHIERYEMRMDNQKYSYLVRPRAVFHTRCANRIMDVYNMLQVRYLAQESRRKRNH